METTRILPDDILEEILVRVPVKSLLRWKCVCKHWYSLFRDYDFTVKHYHFQYALHIAHHGTLPLFLDRSSSCPGPEEERTEFLVLSKRGGDDVLLNVTPDFHRDIPPTFANDYQLNLSFRCLGIVNGVIGLQWERTCLALWNPATREFKEVPRWPIIPDNKGAEEFGGKVLGLGFDQQSQDFKILGQIDFYGAGIEPNVYEYHLYSLKANSWKKVEKQPRSDHDFDYSITDAYLNNGVYYWHAVDKATMDIYNTSVIIAFNFNTELFTEFELPKHPDCHNREHKRTTNGLVCLDCSLWITIGKYKETLAVFISHTMKKSDESDGYVEIWVVTRFREDDHGVPLSWHLALRVSHTPFCIGLRVNKFRECGDLLLMIQYGNSEEEEEDCLYDPTTCTFNNLGVACCSSFTYVESLFSVTRMLN